MEIEVRYIFAPGVERPVIAKTGINWPSPSMETTPIQGDLIAFSADDDARQFEVRNRLFIWESVDRLVVQLLLAPSPAYQS